MPGLSWAGRPVGVWRAGLLRAAMDPAVVSLGLVCVRAAFCTGSVCIARDWLESVCERRKIR